MSTSLAGQAAHAAWAAFRSHAENRTAEDLRCKNSTLSLVLYGLCAA